ncbi:MAG TPA: hydrogenase formation protein HypD [Anaerovoracaceae bacterium]|nr:hydrogenase formation protein HypD [Anaerovoracaceae bacterium]
MMEISQVIDYLKEYNGPEIKLMEVCGTHTASIFKSGIRSLISPEIKLISGPGCPVCVTPTSYIDKCIDYAMMENHVLVTFGDMIKVPGEKASLSSVKGEGAKVEIMYSPFEVIEKATANPHITYVIAAVGFETTAPIYALVIGEAIEKGIKNIKLVTSLKTVIPALEWICKNEEGIDGFICPGHVSVIIGSEAYSELAIKYNRFFSVAGFEPEHILAGIYDLVRQIEEARSEDKHEKENTESRCGIEDKIKRVHNLYKNAVKTEGNQKAVGVLNKYFDEGPAMWRGLGIIEGSGLYLKTEYEEYDGGSKGLDLDNELPEECCCGQVIVGRLNPNECPLFGKACTPTNPYGPCMVSSEGACGIWYRNI